MTEEKEFNLSKEEIRFLLPILRKLITTDFIPLGRKDIDRLKRIIDKLAGEKLI